MTFRLSGNIPAFTWPPDHLGYVLQGNSLNIAVNADWPGIAGSSTVTNFPITLQPGQTNVYFRLNLP